VRGGGGRDHADTDFANMLILAGPMFALYCVGIVVAWAFGRKREE
jgi:Sec-independent protein secretion pathway component TatC